MKKIRIAISVLITFFVLEGNAQCLGKSEGTRAYNRVSRFISHSYHQDKRNEVGATNESESSIKVVESSTVCNQIEQLLNDKTDLDNVAPYDDISKYYYETTNFYYAFWTFHPASDGIPRTGPRRQFIVIKKDFSQYWKYYL